MFILSAITDASYLVGILAGVFFSTSILLIDFAIWRLLVKNDPIFNFRRMLALSFFIFCLWILIYTTGAVVSKLTGNSEFLASSLFTCLALALSIRALVLNSISNLSAARKLAVVAVQPVLSFFLFLMIIANEISLLESYQLYIAPLLLPVLYIVAMLRKIDLDGLRTIGERGLKVARAFFVNWICGIPDQLEAFFSKIGTRKTLQVKLIGFLSKSRLVSVICVGDYHPGPFGKVGSSYLPSLIKEKVEKSYKAIALVPHGVSTHENDLVSREEAERLANRVLSAVGSMKSGGLLASKLVRVRGRAQATCQVFDNTALVTLTLSPNNAEDLPSSLGEEIAEEGRKMGYREVIVVDCHNSLNKESEISAEDLKALREAAIEAMRKARKLPLSSFKIGAAAYRPKVSTERGMGPGGISAIVVETSGQKVAYVVIDGNNMVSGLREEIINALRELKLDDAEVLTTDTHIVTGIASIKNGYYPVGANLPREDLINWTKKTVREALESLNEAKAAVRSESIESARVIGGGQIERLVQFIHNCMSYIKRGILFLGISLLLVNTPAIIML